MWKGLGFLFHKFVCPTVLWNEINLDLLLWINLVWNHHQPTIWLTSWTIKISLWFFPLFPHHQLRMRDLSSPASIIMTSQAQDFELPRKDHHLQGLVELHPQDAGDGVNVSLSLASQAYCRNSDSDPLGSLLPHSLFVVSNGYGQVLASYTLFLHSHF